MSYSRPLPGNVEEISTLKVENLATRTSSSTLKSVFEDYGPVGDVYIPQSHLTKEPDRLAFIRFHNQCDAKNATDALNGNLLDGCELRVQMVHKDVPRYAQPSCGQEGQCHYNEDNHEFQSHSERHYCSTTRIQSRSLSRSSPDHTESRLQSYSSHRGLSSSTKKCKSKRSVSDHSLLDKSHPKSRQRPKEKRKKSKSSSSCKQSFECPEGGGENMEKKQMQIENSDSDVIFVRSNQSKGNGSETLSACPSITSQKQIGYYPDLPKKGACDGSEDPLHDTLSCDNASDQHTFQQYDAIAEEQRECESWMETSLSKSQGYNFMKGDIVNDNYENSDAKYDHLYFASLLGEETILNNQRQMETARSKSMFKSPHRSEANATDTLMAVSSTGSPTRKRCRSQQNCEERPWMEREHMENIQKQIEYLQSKSMFKKSSMSKEDEPEILMLYNRSQKRTRRRIPGLPKANNWMRCEPKTLDVVPKGDSERGQIISVQQSENRTKRECGFWTTNYQGKTNNDDISGGMGFTFNSENSNPQNNLVFLSGLSCHDSSRKGEKQVYHQQPESTCVIPFTPEEDTTEILVEDSFTRDRIATRNDSLEVLLVREMTENRPSQPIHQVALVKDHHRESPETSSHLSMQEPLCSGRPLFPLRDDLNISELQRRYSLTSSPAIKHTESTACTGQSTSVAPANLISVETNKKEHTNNFSHSNQAGMQNSEIISVTQTSNTGLEFPLSTTPYGTSGQTMTEIHEVEHSNFTEINLESCDSSSIQNSRRVHSGDSSISSSVSTSISDSPSNSSTISSSFSSSSLVHPFLHIPTIVHTNIIGDTDLPFTLQLDEDSNEPILSPDPPSEARQETQVANPEESDDRNSWPFLPDFFNFDDIYGNYPKGLTKEQIKTLPIRAFRENDKLNICSICITEYTESSKILILPCSHEYHDECIDHWLSEKSNCPICRRQISNPSDAFEILF